MVGQIDLAISLSSLSLPNFWPNSDSCMHGVGFELLRDLLVVRLGDLYLDLSLRQGEHDATRITDPIWHRLHRHFQIHRVLRLVQPGIDLDLMALLPRRLEGQRECVTLLDVSRELQRRDPWARL